MKMFETLPARVATDPLSEPLQVTIRKAAQLLSYDERTIRRLIIRGELQAVGRGRMRRIALADIREWQRRNRNEGV
jgi:excisionase family DNA binding protein